MRKICDLFACIGSAQIVCIRSRANFEPFEMYFSSCHTGVRLQRFTRVKAFGSEGEKLLPNNGLRRSRYLLEKACRSI